MVKKITKNMKKTIDYKSSWIKLYRQITNSEFWFAERFTKAQAWIDLLLLANHAPTTCFIRGIEVRVVRGQLAYAQTTLADRWKWNERTVKHFLKLLEDRKMIQFNSDNITTVITIQNYNSYQKSTEQTTYQNTEQSKNRIQTNKNDNNDKDNNIQVRHDKNYLLQVPLSDLQVLIKTYRVTEAEVKQKAEELFNYCEAKGKSYKDYRAFLVNALLRKFGRRDSGYSQAGYPIVR